MKKIIIINKIVFFKYLNIVFFNLESKSTLKENFEKIDFIRLKCTLGIQK